VNKLKINCLATSILIFIILSTVALAIPSIPTKWWGYVSINGSLVTEGEVKAYINDVFSLSTSIVGDGLYAIDVPCLSGDIVVLRYDESLTTGELACSPGNLFELNLTDCTIPCGDHEICNVTDNTCVIAPQCSDGTFYSECSATKPSYCDNGNLVNSCDLCGCPSGQNCNSDKSCSTPSGGGGGTYTGGGSSYTSCDENWICTDWSSCLGGTQTRTCTDANNCGTTVNKSVVSQTCTVPCTEDWSCTDWSECVDSLRTRTCTDLKNCGTTVSKPAESEGCVVVSTPPTITGQFLGLTTADWLTAISVGIILALILLFILKRKPKRKR
jgi:hypothetical protein